MSTTSICSVMTIAAPVRLLPWLAWRFALSLDLIWYLLLVSKEVRVVGLYFLSLARPSSRCTRIEANLNALARSWADWGSWAGLAHRLFALDVTWGNHLLLLLILCWIPSASVLSIVLFLLLLQLNLLFFQNLHLVSIFDTCGSFSNLRWVDVVEVLDSLVFVIPTKIELLCLVHIALCSHWVINHLYLVGIIVTCPSTWLLSSVALILLDLQLLLLLVLFLLINLFLSISRLPLLISARTFLIVISWPTLWLNLPDLDLLVVILEWRLLVLSLRRVLSIFLVWAWLRLLRRILLLNILRSLRTLIHKIVGLYLHFSQHCINVLVTHRYLFFYFIFPSHLLVDDGLVFMFVIRALVSFMLSSLILGIALSFLLQLCCLGLSPVFYLLLWMVSLSWV